MSHRLYDSVLETVGGTPLIRASRYEQAAGAKAALLLKAECFNPAGSVKDRVGIALVEGAIREGKLKEGSVIIEPTSGNTGIGLAVAAACHGFRVILTMPDTMSVERRKLLAAYGAELVLTEGAKGMAGAIEKAKELAAQLENSYIPGQFDNPENAMAHYRTTGPEIWEATGGKLDILVAGVGTGGTITGTGRYLKEQDPSITVVAVEPVRSAVLSGQKSGPHGLMGIGAGFVPGVLDVSLLDEIFPVAEEEAYAAARTLTKTEGLLCGITAGAALHAATVMAKRPENEGKRIAVILPDTGERYLSTPLFEE